MPIGLMPLRHCWVWFLVALLGGGIARGADEPRPIPVGLDAYRAWERWPDQRIGMRAYMRSTYDRRGGNEGADASHFLYQRSQGFTGTGSLLIKNQGWIRSRSSLRN